LVVGGSVVLGVAYVASLLAAASDTETGGGWLVVPVVGPFVALSKQEVVCSVALEQQSVTTCSEKIISAARRAMLLLVDGLVQATGASLLTIGLTNTTSELVRKAPVQVTPQVGAGGYGVSLSGSF
jgi:hypothetical protein